MPDTGMGAGAGAAFTASIVIDKNDLITQALKQLSTAQKELAKNKLEIYFDLSNKDLGKKLKEYQKQLTSADYTIKIKNDGIEETYKSLDKLLEVVKLIASEKPFGTGFGDINTENATKQISKLETKISKLTKKYETLEKKSSSVGKKKVSGKNVNLVDNKEFKKLSKSFKKVKGEVDDLKNHFGSVNGDQFTKLGEQVSGLSTKFNELISKYHELSNAQKALSSTPQAKSAIPSGNSNQKKDAFQESTSSVQKATQAIREQNNELDKNLEKIKKTAEELIKKRDIISQRWYKEKDTVVGKNSKGEKITRDVDQFSFVERLKNGQLQTVLATYNKETGKWVEQIINVRTAFEQVEKAIINADNKIASLENTRDKALIAHPRYDTTADDNQIAIERKKRDELQATLDLYAQEKEYVFEIEAANKRIADNQERLKNKTQSQTNLRQAISDEQLLKEWVAAIEEKDKRDAESVKQAKKELNNAWNEAVKVNKALDETKATLSSLSNMPELASNFSDMESKISNLNSDLTSGKITLSEYRSEVKSLTSEYSKMVRIQQKRDVEKYNTNVKVDNAKKLELEKQIWEELSSELNRYSTLQKKIAKGTALESEKEEANELLKTIRELQRSDILSPEKLNASNKKLGQIRQSFKDIRANVEKNTTKSFQSKIETALSDAQKKYDEYSIVQNREDFHPSTKFTTTLSTLGSQIKQLKEKAEAFSKQKITTEEQRNEVEKLIQTIEKTETALKNMPAAAKGVNNMSIEKVIDRINKLLEDNTRFSRAAKKELKGLITLAKSGSASANVITTRMLEIKNAEVAAGRAGKSFFDIFKSKTFYGFIGQVQSYLSMYVGFYGMVNAARNTITTITELDTALVDLKKTTSMNTTELNQFYFDSNKVAKQMGVTTQEIISQASAWSRLNKIGLLYGDI